MSISISDLTGDVFATDANQLEVKAFGKKCNEKETSYMVTSAIDEIPDPQCQNIAFMKIEGETKGYIVAASGDYLCYTVRYYSRSI